MDGHGAVPAGSHPAERVEHVGTQPRVVVGADPEPDQNVGLVVAAAAALGGALKTVGGGSGSKDVGGGSGSEPGLGS